MAAQAREAGSDGKVLLLDLQTVQTCYVHLRHLEDLHRGPARVWRTVRQFLETHSRLFALTAFLYYTCKYACMHVGWHT